VCTIETRGLYRSWTHHDEPGEANGPAAEVAQVRVERLRAGHGEHDPAAHEEGGHAMIGEEHDAVPRAQRQQDRGPPDDLHSMIGPNTPPTRPVP
jgi:hypothetical protein